MLDNAVEVLRRGGLVAFPTETVYGLGADATNSAAVARIFAVKGRPLTNPLIIHVASAAVAARYARPWPAAAEKLADRFWPGPLTLIVAKSPDIVDEATAGRPTVGLRSPDHPLALRLLKKFDGPLAGPSANRSMRVSPTTADHVYAELGDHVDLILDGGACRVGIESTVLDLTADVPTILRPGAVTQQQIEEVIGTVRLRQATVDPAIASISPGQHPIHYAPATPAYRFDTTQRGLIQPETKGQFNGIMAVGTGDEVHQWGPIIAMPKLPDIYARHLYQVLRELDGMNLRALYIEMPPDTPQWTAIRDRLLRATQPLALSPLFNA